MPPSRTYSSDDIHKAMVTIAKIILLHGDQYLALFERLEQEHAQATRREQTMERVRALAGAKKG